MAEPSVRSVVLGIVASTVLGLFVFYEIGRRQRQQPSTRPEVKEKQIDDAKYDPDPYLNELTWMKLLLLEKMTQNENDDWRALCKEIVPMINTEIQLCQTTNLGVLTQDTDPIVCNLMLTKLELFRKMIGTNSFDVVDQAKDSLLILNKELTNCIAEKGG